MSLRHVLDSAICLDTHHHLNSKKSLIIVKEEHLRERIRGMPHTPKDQQSMTTVSPRPHLERGIMGQLSLTGDPMNFNIPTTMGTQEHVKDAHSEDSWQYRTLQVLHSKKCQYLFAFLLLLDILILFGELLILSYYPHCSIIVRDAISCCATEPTNATERFLEAATNHTEEEEPHESFCEFPSVADTMFAAGCNEHEYPGVHKTELAFFYITVLILSIFMVELTISMIALTPGVFFRQFFFALDYVIITISLVLEITFHVLGDDLYQSLSGLLVIIRIWRFVRIGHGIVELTNEAAHSEYNHLLTYTKELRALLSEKSIPLPDHPEMDHFFSEPEFQSSSHVKNDASKEEPKLSIIDEYASK